MSEDHGNDAKWYYDLSSGDVAQGKKAFGHNRMGPYDSEEAARAALALAAARNAAADEAEREEARWRES